MTNSKITKAKQLLIEMAEFVEEHRDRYPLFTHYDSPAYDKLHGLKFYLTGYCNIANNEFTTLLTADQVILFLLFLSTAFEDLN